MPATNHTDCKVEKEVVDSKIAKRFKKLNNGEGTDFILFLNEMQGSNRKK